MVGGACGALYQAVLHHCQLPHVLCCLSCCCCCCPAGKGPLEERKWPETVPAWYRMLAEDCTARNPKLRPSFKKILTTLEREVRCKGCPGCNSATAATPRSHPPSFLK